MHEWTSQHSGLVMLVLFAIILGNTVEGFRIARLGERTSDVAAATAYLGAIHRVLAIILVMLVMIWAGV